MVSFRCCIPLAFSNPAAAGEAQMLPLINKKWPFHSRYIVGYQYQSAVSKWSLKLKKRTERDMMFLLSETSFTLGFVISSMLSVSTDRSILGLALASSVSLKCYPFIAAWYRSASKLFHKPDGYLPSLKHGCFYKLWGIVTLQFLSLCEFVVILAVAFLADLWVYFL